MNTPSFFLPDPTEKGEKHPTATTANMHVMVDLETLGVQANSPILTIGAVLFDPFSQDTQEALWKRAVRFRVDIRSSLQACPKVDGDTLAWWFSQDDKAIKELVGEDATPLVVCLNDYRNYCTLRSPGTDTKFFQGHSQLAPATIFWAKSPDFDGKILENAFTTLKELNPFAFWQYRCVRTIQDLAWPNGPDDRPEFDCGIKHDARADVVNQARTVQAGYLALGISKGVKYDTF